MITARRRSGDRAFDATCMATDSVGDLVAVSGPGRTVTKADVFDYTQLPAVGIIVNKLNATTARVQISGLLKGVYVNLMPGKIYFVGTDSRPSVMPPLGPARRFVQPIGTALDADTLLLSPSVNLTAIRG